MTTSCSGSDTVCTNDFATNFNFADEKYLCCEYYIETLNGLVGFFKILEDFYTDRSVIIMINGDNSDELLIDGLAFGESVEDWIYPDDYIILLCQKNWGLRKSSCKYSKANKWPIN